VRKALPDDARDETWRPIDPGRDRFDPPPTGSYFDAVFQADDQDAPTEPYYWRRPAGPAAR
jgi:hypothetical protein